MKTVRAFSSYNLFYAGNVKMLEEAKRIVIICL